MFNPFTYFQKKAAEKKAEKLRLENEAYYARIEMRREQARKALIEKQAADRLAADRKPGLKMVSGNSPAPGPVTARRAYEEERQRVADQAFADLQRHSLLQSLADTSAPSYGGSSSCSESRPSESYGGGSSYSSSSSDSGSSSSSCSDSGSSSSGGDY